MSRSQVRNSVASWVANGNVTNLNQVWTSFPKRIDFQVNASPGQLTRAAAVVFISDETESRIAIGGAYNGWKRIDYTTHLQIFCHQMYRNAEDGMEDFDALIDAVKDQLRAGGHTLNQTDSIIWQAAEPEISVSYGEPVTNDSGATETWADMQFLVTQMIQA
jgi:hypothetical protein